MVAFPAPGCSVAAIKASRPRGGGQAAEMGGSEAQGALNLGERPLILDRLGDRALDQGVEPVEPGAARVWCGAHGRGSGFGVAGALDAATGGISWALAGRRFLGRHGLAGAVSGEAAALAASAAARRASSRFLA